MWIVALALRRPVTIIAMAALMMLFGLYAFFSMSKDIFPAVNIPEVNLVWYYPHSEFHTAAGADALQSNTTGGSNIGIGQQRQINALQKETARIDTLTARLSAINQQSGPERLAAATR
jgi:hypothetical protein